MRPKNKAPSPPHRPGRQARGDVARVISPKSNATVTVEAVAPNFETSFDQIAVGIAYTTPDGKILKVNRKLCEMLGYAADELVRMTTRDLTHPEDRDRQDDLRKELLKGQRQIFSSDKRYQCKDGSTLWVTRTVALVRDTPESAPYLIQTIDDITHRKQAEASFLRLSRARQVTAQCRHVLIHATNEIAMLNEICRVIVDLGGYNQAWIGLPTGDQTRPVRAMAHAGYGDDQPMKDAEKTAPDPYPWTMDGKHRGAAAGAIETGKTHFVRDILNNPQHKHIRHRARQLGYQSSIALPLPAESRPLGVLVLHAREADAFDDEEINLLTGLAEDISFGITGLRAHAAQVEAEERHREIFEQAAFGITRLALDGTIIDCNQKFCDMLGYSRDELIGKNTKDITHPGDYGPGADFRRRLGASSEKTQSLEKRYVRKDGALVWVRRTMSAALDTEGTAQSIIAVVEDITERKEIEQVNRATFDQAAVGIVHTSHDGRYLRVNRKFCEMMGYEASEMLGRHASEFSPAGDHTRDRQNRELMWAGKLDYLSEEKQYVRKNGTTLWTNRTVSLARDASGKPLYFIRVIEDITARKEADARYRATFDNAPVGIMHTELDSYRILHVNPKLCAMLGYTMHELLNMSSTAFVHPEDQFKDADKYREQLLKGEIQSYSSERRFVHKNGSVLWVKRTVALARDSSGKPLHYIRLVEDITERKQAAEQMARERALLRTIMDAIPSHIYAKDLDGRFILANKTWLEARGGISPDIAGKTVRDFFKPKLADYLAAQDREILRTGNPLPPFEQKLMVRRHPNSPDEVRWGLTAKVPLRTESGEIIGTVGISNDITEEKAEKARREMEHAVTRILAEAISLTDAMAQIMRTMCQAMGWAYGARWVLDKASQTLNRSDHWSETEPDFDPADRDLWISVRHDGNGRFLRHIWVDQQAIWISNLHTDRPFRRKASVLKLGWKSCYGFPIVIDGETVGIIEFFGTDVREADEALVQVTRSIGSQIAQFIKRKQAEDRVTFLAQFDTLTNLPNRFLFTDRLNQMIAQSRRNDWSAALLFVDLDRFKAVNDTHGHAAGDKLLFEVAARLRQCVRSVDTVGRLSGDEFTVMLANLARNEDAGLVAQKIVDALSAPFDINGNETYISASIGVAIYPGDGADADTLLKNADTAMYRAKEQGRNSYQYYLPEMNDQLIRRQHLEALLRGALERKEFLLHYQPKVSLVTGAITGFEALLRWRRAQQPIPPSEFISILEDTGQIVAVGEWVLNEACAQLKRWEAAGMRLHPVAINLSARQFQVKNLADLFGHVLRMHDVDPALIKLELTESMLMSDAEESVNTLHQLKALGVQLSVDNFGTGYSSLAYLKRFPLDELKIDREFIRDAVSDPDDAAIAVTIINLAHSLKIRVVAEGVETEGQISFLRFHDCDEIQGYYFAPPLPADDCTRLLAEDRRLPQPQSPAAGNLITLLLLVENPEELKLLSAAFTPDSFNMLTASNVDDGFEILARTRVDVVIADNDMSGMTGIQFLTRVRKLYANTLRVLASSGDEAPTLTRATNMAGIHLFVPKNWSAEKLNKEVRDALQTYAEATDSSGPHPILKTKKD